MSSSIQSAPAHTSIFENDTFGQVRAIELDDGQVWFVARDVATALGYGNTNDAICQHVEEEDRMVAKGRIFRPLQPQTVLINESGLYALIFGSHKPAAKQFKRWVTSEILPTIRRQGYYALPGTAVGIWHPAAADIQESVARKTRLPGEFPVGRAGSRNTADQVAAPAPGKFFSGPGTTNG